MGRPRGSRNRPKGDNGETSDDVPLRNSLDGDALREYIERVERLNEEIADLTTDRREIFKEIKAAGYDAVTVRIVTKRRAIDTDKRHRMDELLELYTSALGDFARTPLGVAGAERVREEVRA